MFIDYQTMNVPRTQCNPANADTPALQPDCSSKPTINTVQVWASLSCVWRVCCERRTVLCLSRRWHWENRVVICVTARCLVEPDDRMARPSGLNVPNQSPVTHYHPVTWSPVHPWRREILINRLHCSIGLHLGSYCCYGNEMLWRFGFLSAEEENSKCPKTSARPRGPPPIGTNVYLLVCVCIVLCTAVN